MPRKRHSPEQILAKLREVEVALAKGQTIALAVKQIGVSEQTHSTSLRCRLGNQVFCGAVLSVRSNGFRDLITP